MWFIIFLFLNFVFSAFGRHYFLLIISHQVIILWYSLPSVCLQLFLCSPPPPNTHFSMPSCNADAETSGRLSCSQHISTSSLHPLCFVLFLVSFCSPPVFQQGCVNSKKKKKKKKKLPGEGGMKSGVRM